MWKGKQKMNEAIICGLIAGLVSITVALIQNGSTRKLIEYQISELKNEVEKHNNLIARTYELEKTTTLHSEKIENLEKKVNA